MNQFTGRAASAWARFARLFPEREIFLRTNGEVRFLRIGSKVQMGLAAGLLATATGWAGTAGLMMVDHYQQEHQDAQLAKLRQSEARIDRFGASVHATAAELSARQTYLEELMKSHFGDAPNGDRVVGQDDARVDPRTRKISAAVPGAAPFETIAQRQITLAAELSTMVAHRTNRVEAAIRSFGLDPKTLTRGGTGEGGKFIPYFKKHPGEDVDPRLVALDASMTRLDRLERALLAIPSGHPTQVVSLSSPFGYRSDPFNRHAAYHEGLDFRGYMGAPILAAARGKVSFVGQIRGYGNVVQIDHGGGLMTRYAHLSHADVHVGEEVTRGEKIARMGSTGRSTGPHLHFEVRVNGKAINPRPFLEAKSDVLEIQQIAKRRFDDGSDRG